jgi:hypothetical protein
MIIATIAVVEAVLFSASGARRIRTRRQEFLAGKSLDSVHSLPIIDEYLKRQTAGTSKAEVFIASKVAHLFRHIVRTRSFEYMLLHGIRSVLKRGSRISPWRITI